MKLQTTLILALCLVFTGCSIDNPEIIAPSEVSDLQIGGETTPDPTLCTTTSDLIAGQNTIIGTVTVVYDPVNGTLTVTYNTENSGWTVDVTHLWVGECAERPANNPGNPRIGHFPYAEQHSGATSYTYTLDMALEGLDTIGCVAAHAEASGPNGENETAWADGLPYGGNSWAMYFPYDFTQCN